MTWLNPYRWMLLGGLAAALVFGVPILIGRYDEALRDEGRREVRAELAAAAEAQTARNRELQRAAEIRYTVQTGVRDRFITKTITEVRHAAAPLAACPVPELAVGLLNAAAACARGDSPAACGSGEPVRSAR